jgi:hypothetical protein
MTRPYRLYIALIPLLLLCRPSLAQVYLQNYSEWERMAVDKRVAYMVGAVDAMVVFATNEETRQENLHYYSCVVNSKLTGQQLSDNVQSYVKVHPDLQRPPVQIGLGAYLGQLCGFPPKAAAVSDGERLGDGQPRSGLKAIIGWLGLDR